jgi:hypothetical protein
MNVQLKSLAFITFQDAPVAGFEINVVLKALLKFIKDDVVPAFEPFF